MKHIYKTPEAEIFEVKDFVNILATLSAVGSFDYDDWEDEGEEL